MKYSTMTTIGIALILMLSYVFAPVRVPGDRFPVSPPQRLEYLELHKGNALWLALWIDQSFQDGRYPPGRVYGVWMEDLRSCVSYALVGNIFGPGSVSELAACRSPGETWDFLTRYGCRYIVWNGMRADRVAPYADLGRALDTRSVEWGTRFERMDIPPGLAAAGCEVWRVR